VKGWIVVCTPTIQLFSFLQGGAPCIVTTARVGHGIQGELALFSRRGPVARPEKAVLLLNLICQNRDAGYLSIHGQKGRPLISRARRLHFLELR
jgi:hypothetical protein